MFKIKWSFQRKERKLFERKLFELRSENANIELKQSLSNDDEKRGEGKFSKLKQYVIWSEMKYSTQENYNLTQKSTTLSIFL